MATSSWPEGHPTVQKNGASLTATVKYRVMVVDSGPIIKETNVHQWMGRADKFYTVPAVISEIRDAKARNQLQQQWIPVLGLEVKEPSNQAIQKVVEFSKLTGDYPSLSAVDLQVLALVVDLELEGCFTLEHLRTTPKRTIGLGTITILNPPKQEGTSELDIDGPLTGGQQEYDIVDNDDDDNDDSDEEDEEENSSDEENISEPTTTVRTGGPPASWAKVVNSIEGSEVVTNIGPMMASLAVNDASPLDGDAGNNIDLLVQTTTTDVARELELEFPSLAAAATVPFEGEAEDIGVTAHSTTSAVPLVDPEISNNKQVRFIDDADDPDEIAAARLRRRQEEEEERERRKQEALKPISKSGKLYNSFGKYGKLMKPSPVVLKKVSTSASSVAPAPIVSLDEPSFVPRGQSRILGVGGSNLVGVQEMKAEDDDGEGWITCTHHMAVLKNLAGGSKLDPIKGSSIFPENSATTVTETKGPTMDQRAACTTTDFAMQNVLLQMGLILLSVDGMRIRRLKSWVLRCGACFKIHTDPTDPKTGMRRMFCAHCGSDMVQRVSASVDGKTGRLKLHFSKRRQNKHTSARGTKFSLPKPGTGNRFQGDLLLREDQLLMGAWSQKVKKNSGGQARAVTESIFGKDIASNVGCGVTSMPNDIQVGFGKRNPNAAKGRERRGKKKKSTDRACGLRRY